MFVMINSAIKTRLFKHSPKLHHLIHHHHLLTRLYMILILSASSATSITFDFPSFQQSDTNTLLHTEGDAVISNQFMIQLTKGNAGSLGRATYSEPFLLRENTTGRLADFTTSFEFIIDSKSSTDKYYAERVVFFLAPNRSLLNSSPGKGRASYLRLPVSSTPEKVIKLSTQYPFVAVEFNIYRNHEPNVIEVSNSIDSFIAPPLNRGINVDGHKTSTSTATISYNSISKNLSVSLVTSTEYSGVSTQVTSHLEDYMVDLEEYLPNRVVVGFSASTGTDAFALHKIISWNFTSTSLFDHESLVLSGQKKDNPSRLVSSPGPSFKAKSRNHMMPLVALMSIVVGWFILAALLGLGVLNSCKRRVIGRDGDPNMPDLIDVESQKETTPRKLKGSLFSWAKGKSTRDDQNCESIIDNELEKMIGPRKFSYRELVQATSNFQKANWLGAGGFGAVYKGFIEDLNSQVAVKKLKSKQGIEEFMMEVRITSQLRHRNLVKLIGWCHEKEQLLLVYQFMPKGGLDTHLFKETSSLSWEVRYKIARSLASVLHYLHEEWDQCVLHRDIKTSNILLDLNFNMKISDFGLALLMDHGESSVTTDMVVGTRGYMASEYANRGECSKKSDVFSFGVVALEIACGRRQLDEKFTTCNISMVEWIWGLYGDGKVTEAADPNLRGVFDEKQMECLLIVGLWCAHPDYNMRPLIEEAILVLNFNAPLPTLPSGMPTFPASSYQSAGQSNTSSQSSISGR